MTAENTQSEYGDLQVSFFHRWMLAVTENCGKGFPGHTLAHALRKIFLLTHAETVDYTRDGIRFRFHLLDNVCERQYFFTPQYYDREEYNYINAHLPADGVFVDVGANVGIYSLWAAKKMGPAGVVLAIEPNEVVLKRLCFNISLNPEVSRIKVVAMGVGTEKGKFNLYLDPSNLGGSSLLEKGRERVIEVSCSTLFDIVQQHDVSRRISIMKLDIEGYEEVVLRAFFAEAPARILPDALIIENSRALQTGTMPDMLQEAGYRKFLQTKMNSIFQRQDK